VASRGRRRTAVRLVALSSDLGAAYAAQMKAVLLRDLPATSVVDLTHELPAHGVAEAAFVVRAIGSRLPTGSVHVVVVDPGVGGRRVPVAIRCRDGSTLIGPDNGVLVPLAEALGGGTAYRIEPVRLRAAPRVGTTFDGRDLFAPAAARVALGLAPSGLGPAVRLAPSPLRPPVLGVRTANGAVAHIDRFGNVITDVPTEWVPRRLRSVTVRLRRKRTRLPMVTSYEAAGRGLLAVLGSSFGTLEIAVGRGRADRRLSASVGDPVGIAWEPTAPRSRRNRK
jgi:S-adenosyl-L-methionine hydrolase (adenosine-forming)